jgi:hypothetical protein
VRVDDVETDSGYYVLESVNPEQMLLYDIVDPSRDDRWLIGQRFKTQPKLPVVALIQTGYEESELLPYFGTPPVMSAEFHAALLEAGVDNLDVYDAVLRSEDGSVEHRGFKAFNAIGLVSATDFAATEFSTRSASRFLDASIDSLAIDPGKAKGLLMFRLAEFVSAIIVHDRVKRVLEAKGFPHIVFRDPADFMS